MNSRILRVRESTDKTARPIRLNSARQTPLTTANAEPGRVSGWLPHRNSHSRGFPLLPRALPQSTRWLRRRLERL